MRVLVISHGSYSQRDLTLCCFRDCDSDMAALMTFIERTPSLKERYYKVVYDLDVERVAYSEDEIKHVYELLRYDVDPTTARTSADIYILCELCQWVINHPRIDVLDEPFKKTLDVLNNLPDSTYDILVDVCHMGSG